MKATNLRKRWLHSSLTLSFVVGGMMTFASPTRAQSVLADTVYKVNVTNVSNNQSFPKCFRFDKTGVLKIDNTGDGVYGSRFSKKDTAEWQAVITKNQTAILGISGVATGSDFDDKPSNIAGDVINEKGTVFTFKGNKTAQCTIQQVVGADEFAQ